MKQRNERKSVDHTLRHGIRSMLASVARRDDFDLPDLATLAGLRADLAAAEQTAATNLRTQGHSYADLARALGITRQAAHARFSHVEVAA